MNITLRVLSCAVALTLLTGCGDTVKKEYHTKAAKASADVAKKAAKNTMHHGYKAAQAEAETAKGKMKKACKNASNAVCETARDVKNGVSKAASKVANKASEIASRATSEVKRVAHKAQHNYEEAKAEHDHEVVVHHDVLRPHSTHKTVERKELHTVEVEEDNE